MPDKTRKLLNIRSGKAYATAHSLAEQLGMTTTEVVKALREFKSKWRIPSRVVTAEEAKANLSQLMDTIGRREPEKAEPLLSDHADLHDDFGSPR